MKPVVCLQICSECVDSVLKQEPLKSISVTYYYCVT